MRTLLILALLCPLLSAGQKSNKITPLIIGDTLPDMVLSNIINYKSSTARLSSFRGKPVLLDFFATWCGSCMKELPKLDSLQKQFAGQVQIVLVTYEGAEKVEALRKKNSRFASMQIPVVVSDSSLSALFPHRYLPHTVWINRQGRVLATTGAESLTASNLQSLLQGQSLNLTLKSDLTGFDPQRPLLAQPGMQNNLLFQAVFAKELRGAGTSLSSLTDTLNHRQRLTCINYSLPGLWELALGQPFSNRWLLHLNDSLVTQAGEPFSVYKTPWCYERILPSAVSKQQARAWMQQDLARYFNLSASFQKQWVSCWVLVATPAAKALKTKGGRPASLLANDSGLKHLRNQPIAKLVKALNHSVPGHPAPIVLNETGITYNIDITLKSPLNDLPALKKELQPYGLDLLPAQREIEVFVLTENNTKEQPENTTLTPSQAQTKTSNNQPKNKARY